MFFVLFCFFSEETEENIEGICPNIFFA